MLRAAALLPDAIEHDGERDVRKDFDSSATNILEQARRAAASLVEREERCSRSRMRAYEAVASATGCSASWLRRFVNGYGAKPDLIVGFNLLQQHQRALRLPE